MTAIQMRYFLALTETGTGENRNIADVARMFNVNRSTVSRAIAAFVDDGMLDEKFILTEYGQRFLTGFRQKYQTIIELLEAKGVDSETAQDDALLILTECSAETAEFMSQGGEVFQVFQGMSRKTADTSFDGNKLCQYVPEGTYYVEFCFYEDENCIPKHISPVDLAFYHPARIVVAAGTAELWLKPVEGTHKALRNIVRINNDLPDIQYKKGESFVPVPTEDAHAVIPAQYMKFTYLSKERILQGKMELSIKGDELFSEEYRVILKIYM